MWVVAAAGAGLLVMGWSVCRMSDRQDAEAAQRHLLDLLAEQTDRQAQADDRVIADNLDV